jgi:hypothetical protein
MTGSPSPKVNFTVTGMLCAAEYQMGIDCPNPAVHVSDDSADVVDVVYVNM